jgi:tRNA(Ile)-lysidine synthase
VRPLLDARRQALRSYLRGAGVEWNEDPSNEDPKYERARMRAMLARGDEGRRSDAGSIAGMREAAAARVELGERAGAVIRRHARRVSPGLYRLDREFADRDRDGALYALRILLAVAGGRPHLPDASRSLALSGHVSEPGARATLSRSVVETRADGLYLHREWRGLPPSASATPGRLWDDRYRIEAVAGEGMEIAPFGREAAAGWAVPDGLDAPFLRRAALAAEPALWRGGECLGQAPAAAVAGPWARFLPSFDLAAAAAAVALIGGAPLPAPPWPNERPRAP